MIYTSPHNRLGSILGTSPEEVDTRGQGSDRWLLMAVIVLMVIGTMAVYSSIAYFAQTKGTTAGALVSNHMVKLCIAFITMLIVSKIDYHKVAKFSRIGVILSWILLIVVLINGEVVFGARRSLNVAGFSFQPSSLAITSLVLHVAVLLREKQEYIGDYRRAFLPILFWVLPTCMLIGIEDFSSAGLLLAVSLLLMFAGRIPPLQIATLVLIGLMGGALLIGSSKERQSRLKEYVGQIVEINSSTLESGSSYQAQQSWIAIARGGLLGVGIGKSTQRDFLPAPYNDFIFSIIAEEYGLLGAGAIIFLFSLILVRGIAFIARRAEDPLGMLVATGCTVTIVLYGFINAGVASGLLPVTGLPMPFVSYGGTSMLFTAIMLGLLLNISKRQKGRRNRFYFG